MESELESPAVTDTNESGFMLPPDIMAGKSTPRRATEILNQIAEEEKQE